MFVLQPLNLFLYNDFYSTGLNDPMNITINFIINMGISLFLT